MEKVFKFKEPADCFCEDGMPPMQFSTKIIKFIEQAVKEKIEREKKR